LQVIAQVFKRLIEHGAHALNILKHALLRFGTRPLDAEPEARQRSTQVVTDGSKHALAIVEQ
jgi:hypothetical protein